jgi:rhamnosyltransferase subunit B
MKRRAVLLVGERPPAGIETAAGDDVLIVEYAPYSMLFARAAAIIHQGGIGTSAQALRAGRPQLVVPFSGDQPDNAARLTRLGVARTITRRHYRPDKVRRELQALLDERSYALRASRVSADVRSEEGARRAARLLATLSNRSRRPS